MARRGVRAVGVDLIAETAGTTKTTLYDRFGSKDALVALSLLRRAHRWRGYLLARLAETGRDRAEHVLLVFEALETWMAWWSGRTVRGFNARYATALTAIGQLLGADDEAPRTIRGTGYCRELLDRSNMTG